MNFKHFTLLIVFTLYLSPARLFAQRKTKDERLKLAREFFDSFMNPKLTNEQIMKKFVVEGRYLKNDTVTKEIDITMAAYREYFKTGKDVTILKYSGHEDEFAVRMRPIGQPEIRKKMIFQLGLFKGLTLVPMNIDDVYAVKFDDGEDDYMFMLINDKKIISFIVSRLENTVAFLQF